VHPVLLLTLGYFGAGAAAMAAITLRRPRGERRERWTKYFVYFVVVHAVIAAILAGPSVFPVVAAALIAAGARELVGVGVRAPALPGRTLLVAAGVFGVLALGFLEFARHASAPAVLFVYVVVLTFDGFSQLSGQLLGRRRLAPRVSPGKTVEGLAGGMAMAVVTALPLSNWTGIDRARALGLAAAIALAALAGDLAASAFKRACRVKDYGRLLPGHGGVLDRFDSFIAAGSVYWAAVVR
jgi:phosphatidate cytidylyltransferase